MEAKKRARLERAGWKVGTVDEFLGLTPEEGELVELRLRLARAVALLRKKRDLTQAALAKRIGSSQSRVAKAEAGDPTVSLDLLVKTLLSLGAGLKEIGDSIATASSGPTGPKRARKSPVRSKAAKKASRKTPAAA